MISIVNKTEQIKLEYLNNNAYFNFIHRMYALM